jgi:predicted peptidase
MDKTSSVTIYDRADNKTTINCRVVDKSTTIQRSYTSKVFTTSGGKKYEYWLYTPKHSARDKMPLLVYFHGDGGRKSLNSVNDYAYPNFISNGADFPFYMIAPHVDSTDDFGTDARMEKTYELINYIIKNYNIDSSRIIVSGGSSGSRGAYRMAAQYKNLFSCMVIGSGILYQLYDDKLTHIPIWFFHGELDSITDYRDIERHANNINTLGGNAKVTIIKSGKHDITETVFKREDLIKWMVSQKKK